MPDTKLRKQRSPEEMLSINAGQCFSPPTALYDAACMSDDMAGGYGLGAEDYQHRSRFVRLMVDQGGSTLSRDSGDFDYFGGVPDRLMNGK